MVIVVIIDNDNYCYNSEWGNLWYNFTNTTVVVVLGMMCWDSGTVFVEDFFPVFMGCVSCEYDCVCER